jgi:hypothetical protein
MQMTFAQKQKRYKIKNNPLIPVGYLVRRNQRL